MSGSATSRTPSRPRCPPYLEVYSFNKVFAQIKQAGCLFVGKQTDLIQCSGSKTLKKRKAREEEQQLHGCDLRPGPPGSEVHSLTASWA